MKHSIVFVTLFLGISAFIGAAHAARCPKPSNIDCSATNGHMSCVATSSAADDFVVHSSNLDYHGNLEDAHPTYMGAQFVLPTSTGHQSQYQGKTGWVTCDYSYFNPHFGPERVLTAVTKKAVMRTQLDGDGWVNYGRFGAQCSNGKSASDCSFKL